MWVKICGNTNLEDSQLAIESGAHALGFIFAESKRQVTPAQVASITAHLPEHIERVGVFYSHDAGEISEIVREAGLSAVQLHGGFDPPLVQQLQEMLDSRIRLIQTVHWVADGTENSTAIVGAQLKQIRDAGRLDRVLIDSRVGQAGGGTGVSYDWKAAHGVLAESAGNLKIIVAGGLRPENVTEAIRELNPWGVDVSSGVEASPGRKDPEKLRAFIQNALQAKVAV
jgi:phosphoribosylanthranilate isomerase